MNIGKYKLEYAPKVQRAIQAVGDKDSDAILVEYDRLGGLITLNGEKVKRGSFFDVKTEKAFVKPQVVVLKKAKAATEERVKEEEVIEEPKKTVKKAK